jgi:glucosyl-3-phosphoglycerate synthase
MGTPTCHHYAAPRVRFDADVTGTCDDMRDGDRQIPTGIDPEVWDWLPRRSSRGSSWALQQVLRSKGAKRISVVLPARNEEQTVGRIVAEVRRRLGEDVGLVDEVIVIDSRSCDATATVAAAAGAVVRHQDEVLPDQPRMEGKGDALWKGLAASTGDVVIFVDSDLRDFNTHFIVGLLGPLLCEDGVEFVKAHYLRPLVTDHGTVPGGGGRVSELVARPLINMFWPRLAGFVQPLAGEYGGYRHVLERIRFVTGYGVEFAMLVDLLNLVGLDALAQVDLGTRTHRHHDIEALGRMAAQILQTAASQLQREHRGINDAPASTWLTQFRHDASSPVHHQLMVSDIAVQERPPLAEIRHVAELATTAPADRTSPLAHQRP